jgi:hypothetical protein
VKRWPKMGSAVTFIVHDGRLRVGVVTGTNRSAHKPLFYVDGIYTLAARDEHVTWMRGAFADTESKRAFLSMAKLVGSVA